MCVLRNTVLYSETFAGQIFTNYADELQFAKMFPANTCIIQAIQIAVNSSVGVHNHSYQ